MSHTRHACWIILASLFVIALAVPAFAAPGPRVAALPETPQATIRASGPPAMPPRATRAVLYDQYDNTTYVAVISQNCEPAYDAWDIEAADDFVVPAGFCWSVQGVEAAYIAFAEAISMNVRLYRDDAYFPGLPGVLLASQPDRPVTGDPTNQEVVIALSPPVVLDAGHYWISIQANQDFGSWWAWGNRSVQSNGAATLRNPGNGFGTGCTTWSTRGAGCNSDPANPDQVFRLTGTVLARCPRAIRFDGALVSGSGGVNLAPIEPNPATGAVRLAYSLGASGPVRLLVYDVSGRMVERLVERSEAAGEHALVWDLDRLSAGIYFLRLEAGGEALTERVTLSR